jgi:hypothetical protein
VNIATLVWVAAVVWLLYRQIERRRLGGKSAARRYSVVLVLAALGVFELARFVQRHPLDATTIALLCASFAVGCGLGGVRAFTVRIWIEDGAMYCQGTLLTVALWLLATALHLVNDKVIVRAGGPEGAGTATMLLYLALAMLVQIRVLRIRARSFLRSARSGSRPRAARSRERTTQQSR